MRIVADENMPLVRDYFESWGELVTLPGRSIRREDLMDTDILLVRSITQVDQDLLSGTGIRFVGSATIGTDHLDIDELPNSSGIQWTAAPGCNAVSVAEYVVCCIAALNRKGILTGKPVRAGVIGVGNVGRRVAERLNLLGFEVFLNDPPRSENEPDFDSIPLKEMKEMDLICLHTPLTRKGPYRSFHLIDDDFLKQQKTGTVLLSAGRGDVIDFSALNQWKSKFRLNLDVWEPEPKVNTGILEDALIATPHVAGYAIQAKWRGTRMLYEKAAGIFDKPLCEKIQPLPRPELDFQGRQVDWREVVLSVYNPEDDTRIMKESILESTDDIGKVFDALRKNYRTRHEFDYPVIRNAKLNQVDLNILNSLGLNIQ
jgi:erythronate-4-phosphate dehydrogenase